jgi:transposase
MFRNVHPPFRSFMLARSRGIECENTARAVRAAETLSAREQSARRTRFSRFTRARRRQLHQAVKQKTECKSQCFMIGAGVVDLTSKRRKSPNVGREPSG